MPRRQRVNERPEVPPATGRGKRSTMSTHRKGRRVAGDVTAGMKQVEEMIAGGKRPAELFTARTIEIPDPSVYSGTPIGLFRWAPTTPNTRAGLPKSNSAAGSDRPQSKP